MKKIILFVTISILFQSCYSYRPLKENVEPYFVGKKYKIYQDKKILFVKIKKLSDSTIVYTKYGNEGTVYLNTVTEAKVRKFSVVKTIIISAVVIGLIYSMIAFSDLAKGIGKLSAPSP